MLQLNVLKPCFNFFLEGVYVILESWYYLNVKILTIIQTMELIIPLHYCLHILAKSFYSWFDLLHV